ncbi:Predicted rubrerythrin Rbr [Desulfamplus magnetovallimortis]|jgi:rubrerythrin|uniref:Predicted rubrerythrin Rbr n=1 Tax=Desulfamplus magnetovallimortis TaxID=1246637 RepID=A0A1W1H865_9BACT|nr:ferritin family protein [Desulfamplus magnetovallimortis]SLM28624.1 Predicted rubrerythrin Rbr [Desulfamplus magnetovallimortis]
MNFESVDDILAYAIEKEKEAVQFYTELAGKEKFKSVKETFENFAKEEGKHVTLLEGLKTDKGKVEEYELKEIPDLKISNYLVETEYKEGMFMQDILRIAMKREEMAVKLYNDLAQKTKNAEVVRVLNILSQEEAKHKLGLETMYDDFLADNEN